MKVTWRFSVYFIIFVAIFPIPTPFPHHRFLGWAFLTAAGPDRMGLNIYLQNPGAFLELDSTQRVIPVPVVVVIDGEYVQMG